MTARETRETTRKKPARVGRAYLHAGPNALRAACEEMAADRAREAEALEWAEALCGDALESSPWAPKRTRES